MLKVFVVILNWNRAEDTIACLDSVEKLAAKDIDLKILLVDNASEVDDLEEIKKYTGNRKNITLIENEKNFGFAEGNNVGIRHALANGADYVMILNNDTLVDIDLVNSLVLRSESDKRIGAISPKIYFAPGFEFHKDRYQQKDLGKVIWYAGGEIDWNNVYGTTRGVDRVDEGDYNETIETDFATGTCLLLRASALNEIGLFDSKYFMYFEDTDLSQRFKKDGWKVIYEPKGIVWHKVAQSSGIGSELNDYFITRNRLIFGMRWAPLRAKIALLRESLRFLFTGRKWQKIGTIDYYLGKFGKGSWK